MRDDLYVELTAHQFEQFDAHFIGVGTNPVTELYPIMRSWHHNQGISDNPAIVQYKERLSEILGRARRP